MQIILIPGRLAKARTLSLTLRHLVASAVLALVVLAAMSSGLYWLTLKFGGELRVPFIQQLVLSSQRAESDRAKEFVQQNLNAMAVKLGEMQAQLTRLDALGERLSGMAGLRPQDFRFSEPPGRGGAVSTSVPPQNLSLLEFGRKLSLVSREVENRADMLGVLDAQLFEQTVRKKLTPTILPIDAPFNASGFGWRIDPITGQHALHEGIDFIADVGTRVVAAAAGRVVFAGYHPQYGNVVDVDHGNDLMTRYAHLSRMHVAEGEFVQRALPIGESGSTGRSTGPHLHFEVRFRGTAQNPMQFLQAAPAQAVAARR